MSTTGATAPSRTWLDSLSLLPRGVSQIFFQNNVWTGLLILLAFLVADWQMALLVVIGAVCSTLAGYALRVDPGHFDIGFQGFNGALIGAAAFTALGDQGWSYVATIAGGVACAPVTWFFGWLFATRPLARYALPSTTAPFCTVAGIIYALTTSVHVRDTPHHVADGTGESMLRSLLTNVSEVVLVNSVWSGALILIGLFVASWKVGLAASMGSIVGTLCAWAMGETSETINEGLSGYSGVLTAIALAAVFLVGTAAAWVYAAIGAAITAVTTLAMTDWYGDPHYTWPYILTTWVLLVVAAYIPALKRP
ncbi:urea transporter [Nocardioides sp. zg-DK7169]|uniref:urea transporter n=1 Tax=Nocardioides sp. zg-DK7169 TaxID=2736600 RepID=UPI0015516724|nr:urea transporter [Nocardioides sp. zg-DK7169]NPC96656.1 urea transporter [Nocardioides sp. zg-DK7169]